MLPVDVLHDKGPIRLAIVCPHPLISRGLERIFQEDQRLVIVKEIPTLNGLADLLATIRPDVTLIDWDLVSHSSETKMTIRAASNYSHCLLLMHRPEPHDCRTALGIGARGMISKSSTGHVFRRAVWKVYKRGIWIDPTATEAVIEYALSPSSPVESDRRKADRLTPRERQIVELVCKGYRNKRIAAELRIAETTVCHHLTSVFGKLEVNDRMGLIVFAHRNTLPIALKNDDPYAARARASVCEWPADRAAIPGRMIGELPV